MDITMIRREFPILDRSVNNRKLIYLDNAATTQVPDCVLDAFTRHYHTDNANAHRALHFLGTASTGAVEETRKRTAEFIGAEGSRNIIFTSGTTAAIGLAAGSYVLPALESAGTDAVITTVMEHHSNYLPWLEICKKSGAGLKVTGLTPEGTLDLEQLKAFLSEGAALLAVTFCSNVTGAVNPVGKIVEMAHRQGVPVLVDAAQYVRDHIIDVRKTGVDFLCFSAHKMMGPPGLGVLYASDKMLDAMEPFMPGGGTVYDIKDGVPQYEEPPACFEAGTANIGGIAAFGETLSYIERVGRDAVILREQMLTGILKDRLKTIPGVGILGPETGASGSCVSINVEGCHFYDLAVLMDKQGVAVRSGNHCAVPLHQELGLTGSLRFSPAFYNTEQEIETAVTALERAIGILGADK